MSDKQHLMFTGDPSILTGEHLSQCSCGWKCVNDVGEYEATWHLVEVGEL